MIGRFLGAHLGSKSRTGDSASHDKLLLHISFGNHYYQSGINFYLDAFHSGHGAQGLPQGLSVIQGKFVHQVGVLFGS